MTERDFFIEMIPQIAELVVECRKMEKKDYEDYKQEMFNIVDPRAVPFLKKVFIVIERVM